MILLDTNALLWLETGHARGKKLLKGALPLSVSPASLLEVQFLVELGRVRLTHADAVRALADDARWALDEPPLRSWFEEAMALSWTRDPFDRLIVAHALSRGWRLATGDSHILGHLEPRSVLEL